MSATSEPRLPFDDESIDVARPVSAPRVARLSRPRAAEPDRDLPDAARAAQRRRSRAERRARGVGRHRQDARPGRALRQSAARRRRARSHPRDHVHAQGRGRDARAHHRAAAAKRAGCREFDAGALARPQGAARRHRDLDDRRLLPVAAARVSARGRRRSGLRPRRRHRGAAAGRRVARSGAAHLPRASRATTTTWRWCSRSWASGGCAAAWRRCSIGGWWRRTRCAGFSQSGPRDLTAATRVPRRPRRGCATSSAASATASSAFLADGPVRHPQFAMLADDICGAGVAEARPRSRDVRGLETPRRAGGVPGAGRSAARLLPDAGRPAARRARSPAPASRRPTATATTPGSGIARRRRQIAPAVADAIRGFRRDLNVVMSRGVWRIFAVALQQYQRTLDAHALLDFSGVLERAVKLLKEMDEFAREPLPARGALPARAGRRVPGHQPRAVGARRAAGQELGRRASAPRADAHPAVDLHRRRSEAVDLRVPRRRRRGARRGGAVHRRRCGPTAMPRAGDHGQLPVGAGDAGVRERRVRRDRRGDAPARAGRDAFRYGDTRSVSGRREVDRADPVSRRRPTEPLGFIVGDTRAARPPSGWRTRSSACCPARPCAIGRPASAARPRSRPTSPSCSARATATASSKRRSSGAACRPTSTRGWGSSTPTRSRTPWRCCGTWPIRCRICAPRRCCDRASCGCRTRRSPRLGAATARRRSSAPSRRRRDRDARRRGSRGCSIGFARAVPRWLSWVDRLDAVGAARRGAARDGVRVRAARAAPPAGAREPEEAARHDPARCRTAATRRSPASPTISSGWRSATSRTPRSTRSTPSA